MDFCQRRLGDEFRFAPCTQEHAIDYEPRSADAPRTPPQELVSALRFASALMPALTRKPGREVLGVFARHPADMDYFVEGEIRNDSDNVSDSVPRELCEVFRHLFRDYSGFRLEVSRGGLEANATLLERAYYVDLRLAKAVNKANAGRCFEVNGRPTDCGNPERLLQAIRSLEAAVPRRDREEIVLVLDDTHGMRFDVGVTAMSVPADVILDNGSQDEFRESIAGNLEDFCDEFGLDDADRIDIDQPAVSLALDGIHAFADSEFEFNMGGEFDYRIAAFRNGKLIAFFGDKWEVQNDIAGASLRIK